MDIKLYSYLFGLFGTDGNVRRTTDGQHIYDLTLELVDKDIIDKIFQALPNCSFSERLRNTNFKKNYHSYVLRCHNKEFIQWCEQNDFPIYNKTTMIAPPKEYSESDFWRGVIDGDGSLGMKTVEQQPFINLTTDSDNLKEAYCDYIYKLTSFRPKCNRNKRDNIYNITLHGTKALTVAKSLYIDSNIYLQRKYDTYLSISTWHKKDRKGKISKKWTQEEVEDLMQLTDEDFHKKYPERTLVAIKAKRRKMGKEVMLNVNK